MFYNINKIYDVFPHLHIHWDLSKAFGFDSFWNLKTSPCDIEADEDERFTKGSKESFTMRMTKPQELSLREKLLPGTPYHIWKDSDIADLRKTIGATQEEFARILGVVAATVHRWEKGIVKPEPQMARKLGRLKEIVDLFQAGFEVEGLKFFFTTPHPRLQGDRPMDLLNFDSGTERVKGLIESAMTGAM